MTKHDPNKPKPPKKEQPKGEQYTPAQKKRGGRKGGDNLRQSGE